MVDWERAALTHPYLDLATFSNFINLSDVEALDRLALQERATITEDDGKNFLLVLRSFSYAVYGAVFLGLVSDLAQIEFESRDATPTLSECYRRMGKGELDHKNFGRASPAWRRPSLPRLKLTMANGTTYRGGQRAVGLISPISTIATGLNVRCHGRYWSKRATCRARRDLTRMTRNSRRGWKCCAGLMVDRRRGAGMSACNICVRV